MVGIPYYCKVRETNQRQHESRLELRRNPGLVIINSRYIINGINTIRRRIVRTRVDNKPIELLQCCTAV